MAKTTRFNSEDATGVPWVSFGGGTHIFIKAVGLVDNPQSHTVWLETKDYNNQLIRSPPLTEDDAFNSQPALGNIAYRLPSLPELFGFPQSKFDKFINM